MKRIADLYRNAFGGLSAATWWLSLVMLVNRSGTMVIPFMTLYLTQTLHYTIGRAGLVMGVFGMGAVCGGFLGGRLTDKLGFYNVQLGALLCGGIMFLVLGQADSFPLICVCAFVLATLNDSFRPANATAIAQYSKEENRTRSYSLNRLAINLGWAVGGAVGGVIASHNYHMIFWVDGITNIAAAILLRLVLSPRRNPHTPAHKAPQEQKAPSAYADRMYMVFIGLVVMFGISFFQIFSTLPVYYHDGLHLTPFFIGVIMALNGGLIALFEMALVFRLESERKNLTFIMYGCLLVGLSFVVFNVLPGEKSIAVLAAVIVTGGEMLSMPFMNSFWVVRTVPGNRGQYAGLYTSAWSIAQITGPAAGAQIAQWLGFHTLWWCVAVVSIATSLGFRWIRAKEAGITVA